MTNSIVIADDHPLFRQALRSTIAPIFSKVEVLETESLKELRTILQANDPQLLLLDLRMPDSQGLAGLMMIKGTYPALPIIIVSASEEPEIVRAAIQAGASGYIYKSYSLKQIHDAVVIVNGGGVYVPDNINQDLVDAELSDLNTISKISSLTPAQLRVFLLMTQGMMNKQIAAEMEISEATVKAHITSIYKKLGVRTRTQAVMVSKALDIAKLNLELTHN